MTYINHIYCKPHILCIISFYFCALGGQSEKLHKLKATNNVTEGKWTQLADILFQNYSWRI